MPLIDLWLVGFVLQLGKIVAEHWTKACIVKRYCDV